MNHFELLSQPIGPGVKLLLEASAGTGKTFNIANLYLRLVLEGVAVGQNDTGKWTGLEVGNILVVTYTRLATAELIERIRGLLVETLALIEAGSWNKDDFPGKVIEQALNCGGPAERKARCQLARLRLRAAITGFDRAAIMTIHGFCSRMLNEFAFESGEPFGLEMAQEDDRLIEEAAANFWRRRFYPAGSEMLCSLATERGLTCDALVELARQVLPSPDLQLNGEGAMTGDRERELEPALNRFRAAWRPEIPARIGAFTFKTTVPSPLALLPELQRIVIDGAGFGGMFAVLRAFTSDAFAAAVNRTKCKQAPSGALATLLAAGDELELAVTSVLTAVRWDFIRYLREERPVEALKSNLRVRSYNDLLLDLHAALAGPAGSRLTKLIREKFKVAMIDEFQDTDPLQYEIFSRVFNHPECMLMMVGDPKQSIYSFRGADIYAYLQVKTGLPREETPTLSQNFRSVPRLIEAVNHLFSAPYSFAEPEISFAPVASGKKPRPLVVDGVDTGEQPFRLWFLANEGGSGPINVAQAERTVSAATATAIAELLDKARNGEAYFLGDDGSRTPLPAGDIAILVNKHAQAYRLKQELASRGVNAVMQCAQNVFASAEAREFFLVINAIANPGNLRVVKSALVTSLLRVPPETVFRYGADDTALAEFEFWLDRFNAYRRSWERDGFMAMFNRFLQPEKNRKADVPEHKDVRANLAGFGDGERRLTNILQLAELTHQAIREYRFGMAATLEWLRGNVNKPEINEEQEQRLESDEAAVKILTVFKSKGLQFPVVFCPFVWEKAFSRRGGSGRRAVWHERRKDGWSRYLAVDDRDDARIARQCRRELLSEKLRLLYVALTRAVNCCLVATGEINQAGDAALTFLQRRDWDEATVEAYLDHDKQAAPDAAQLAAIWNEPGKTSPVRIEPLPVAVAAAPPAEDDSGMALVSLQWPEGWRIPRNSGVMSFTVLAAGEHHAVEANPDLDDQAPAAATTEKNELISAAGITPFASFPRGAVSGDCIHRIFEQLDFSVVKVPGWAGRNDVAAMLESQMRLFGRDAVDASGRVSRLSQLAAMLEQVLRTPLPAEPQPFSLCDLAPADRLAGMNFFFRVREDIDLPRLEQLIRTIGLTHYRREYGELLRQLPLQFAGSGPRQGYMTGKIDLFFRCGGKYYLLDWKSNHLGDRYHDYRPSRLLESMFSSSYLLQYLIYVLAADKYLRRNLPGYDYNTHFGGVFYLYVRGINGSNADTGIFCDRPEFELVRELDMVFPDRKGAGDDDGA